VTTGTELRDVPAIVRALHDTQQVVDALHRFGAGQDLRDPALFLSAFAPDAVLDFTQPAREFGADVPVMQGRDAIATILTTLEPLATTHTVTNPGVVLDGDRARLWALARLSTSSDRNPPVIYCSRTPTTSTSSVGRTAGSSPP
jgi:hypothetical protein